MLTNNNKEDVYINNNEDNRNHFFVNLSHLLLREIISKLDDCLDIICFSLVCKRWFQERNCYLDFNKSILGLRFFKLIEYIDERTKIKKNKKLKRLFKNASINNYYLNSYNCQIQNAQTINNDEESILFLYENGEYIPILDLNNIARFHYIEIIKNNKFKKVYFKCQQPSLESYLEEIKKIDDFATCNVSMAMKTSISSLINIKVLPSFIKYIELADTEHHSLLIECLPSCLEALTLGSSYDAIVDLAQLPTTLKYLCLGMRYYHPIKSLPKSLEELRFTSDYGFLLDETILPATLHTLIGICNRMAPGAYRSLKKLFITLYGPGEFRNMNLISQGQATPTDVIEIPPFVEELSFTSYFRIPFISRVLKLPITSLTKLTLYVDQIESFEKGDSTHNNGSNSNNNTGLIPSSVVYLNLSIQNINQTTPFSISRLLKSPNTSQLKTLILSFSTNPSLDSNSFTFGNREDGIGLDSLHFYFSIKKQLTEGIVPNGIKDFTPPIQSHDSSSLSPTSIPSSVEKLDILFYANPFKIPYLDGDMVDTYDDNDEDDDNDDDDDDNNDDDDDEDTVDINEDYNTVGANDDSDIENNSNDSDMDDNSNDIVDDNTDSSTTLTKTINIVPSNVRHINIYGSALLECYDCIPISIKSFTVKNGDQDYHFRRLDKKHFIMMSDNHLHYKPRCGIIKESTILNSYSLFGANRL